MKTAIRKLVNSTGFDYYRIQKPAAKDGEAKRAEREKIECQRVLDTIPVVPVTDILGEARAEIKITVQKYEDGMMPLSDAVPLLSILVKENPAQVLEIGTFMGHTTRAMAENLPNATIHTMDLPLDYSASENVHGKPPKDDFHLINRRIVGREYKGRDCEKRITQHLGDSAEYDFAKTGKPVFFFIDGSHTYEYCKSDSEKCLALCPRGGTFLWHDCDVTHPGVVRFVSEWRSMGRNIVRIQGSVLAYWKNA